MGVCGRMLVNAENHYNNMYTLYEVGGLRNENRLCAKAPRALQNIAK